MMKRLLRPALLVLPAVLATEVRSQPSPPLQAVTASVETAPASSTPDGFPSGLKTDPATVMTEPETPRPAYLVGVTPSPFGVPIMRIANNTGSSTASLNGRCRSNTRYM